MPFLARWPGHIKAGSTSDALIAHIDTLATFSALTGEKLAPTAGPDSFNVLPALLGEGAGREHLVLQNNNQSPLALREKEWVLIEKGGGPKQAAAAVKTELFNLAADPTQKTDLTNKEPERVKAMSARLELIRSEGHSRPE